MIKRKLLAAALAALVCLSAGPAGAGETDVKPKLPPGVPAGAEAWVVLPAPKTSVERATKMVEAVVPGMGAAAAMFLQKGLVKHGGEAQDAAKPLVMIFSMGKKPKSAVAVSLKAGGDAARALEVRFGKPTKTEAGISTYLEVQEGALPDKQVYAAVKDGRLVIGDDIKLVKLLAATAAPAAGAYPKDLDAVAGMDVKAAATQHKEKIEEFLKNLEEDPLKALGAAKPGGAGGEEAKKKLDMVKMVGATYAGLIRSSLEEVRLVEGALRIGADELSISYGLTALAGGELEKVLAKMSKAKLPSVKGLPKNAMVTVAAAMSPEVMTKLMVLVNKVMDAALAAEGDEKLKKELGEYVKHATAVIKQMDGKFAEVICRRGGGLSAVAVGGVKDAEASRAETLKALKALQGLELAKKWKEMGLKWELKENVRKSGGLNVDRMTFDIKFPANPALPPEMQAQVAEQQKKMLEAMYGMPMVYEVAFSKRLWLVAFGKEAPKALDELVARTAAGGGDNDALTATLKRAPAGAFMVGEISIREYAYMAIDMVGKMAPPGMMPEINLGKGPDKNPASFWAVARDGKLTFRYNLPVAPVKAIVAAVRKAQEDMMKGMQPPQVQPGVPQPGPGIEQF